jgi:MFS family permease
MTARTGFAGESMGELAHGIRENLGQFLHQLLQVLLVGFAIGMMRTVVPALAESEFGVARGSFLLLTAFVVAFGVVKGVLNFVAGRLSERVGRKQVLVIGWMVALPIPVMIWLAPNWSWIVAATLLLGVNQGLCWSMTQTAKLDITRPDERGLTIGLNEFSGYVGVALAGILTGYAATALGPRAGLLVFGLSVVLLALVLALVWVRDTLPWAHAEAARHAMAVRGALRLRYPEGVPENPTTREVFALMSWRDRRLAAICQAGLVEKFVDALVWVILPAFLYQRGVSLPGIGWIVGIYGFVWGGSQPGGSPTMLDGTGRTSSACGSAAAASRSSSSATECPGGLPPPASPASAWRCSIRTSRRPSRTSRRRPGAARRSASTASGATSPTPSARSGSGSLPSWRAVSMPPSGSSRLRCFCQERCCSAGARRRTRA